MVPEILENRYPPLASVVPLATVFPRGSRRRIAAPEKNISLASWIPSWSASYQRLPPTSTGAHDTHTGVVPSEVRMIGVLVVSPLKELTLRNIFGLQVPDPIHGSRGSSGPDETG